MQTNTLETTEPKVQDKIPGVLYKTRDGQEFVVDMIWALALNDKRRLEEILLLDQPYLGNKLREISLSSVMRKTYTLAECMMDKEGTPVNSYMGKAIETYYYSLSPTLVEWQLAHPRANAYLAKATDISADIVLKLLGRSPANDEDVFEIKRKLAKMKGRSSRALQRY